MEQRVGFIFIKAREALAERCTITFGNLNSNVAVFGFFPRGDNTLENEAERIRMVIGEGFIVSIQEGAGFDESIMTITEKKNR